MRSSSALSSAFDPGRLHGRYWAGVRLPYPGDTFASLVTYDDKFALFNMRAPRKLYQNYGRVSHRVLPPERRNWQCPPKASTTMADNALEDLMETLSTELDNRLEAAAGKRLHFVLIASDVLETSHLMTNASPSVVRMLAQMLRRTADEPEKWC
jgi:hypothetical protein